MTEAFLTREMLIQGIQYCQRRAWPPEQLDRLVKLVPVIDVQHRDEELQDYFKLIKEVELVRKAHSMLAEMTWRDWYSKAKVEELRKCVKEAEKYTPYDEGLAGIKRTINSKSAATTFNLERYRNARIEGILKTVFLVVVVLLVAFCAANLYVYLSPMDISYEKSKSDLIKFRDRSFKLVYDRPGILPVRCIYDCKRLSKTALERNCTFAKHILYFGRPDYCDPLLAL